MPTAMIVNIEKNPMTIQNAISGKVMVFSLPPLRRAKRAPKGVSKALREVWYYRGGTIFLIPFIPNRIVAFP
jgi:hypothetical protein